MLAKGKVFVSLEKLTELLSLPEGVEIIAVKPKGSVEEGFDFLVMSAEETVCTKKDIPLGLMRRTSVETLENHKNSKVEGVVESVPFPEVHRGHAQILFDDLGGVTVIGNVVSLSNKDDNDSKDVKDSFKDILNSKGIF